MQNKNSNTNTILLVIIILLLCALLFWKMGNTDSKKLFSDNLVNKNQLVIPNNNSNYKAEPTPTPTPNPVVNKPTYEFLKDILVGYPDSVIQECNFSGKNYFYVIQDKVAQNGGHIVGSSPVFYTKEGVLVGSCNMNPTISSPAICSNNTESCPLIYASDKSFDGGVYDNGIDIYNLR